MNQTLSYTKGLDGKSAAWNQQSKLACLSFILFLKTKINHIKQIIKFLYNPFSDVFETKLTYTTYQCGQGGDSIGDGGTEQQRSPRFWVRPTFFRFF